MQLAQSISIKDTDVMDASETPQPLTAQVGRFGAKDIAAYFARLDKLSTKSRKIFAKYVSLFQVSLVTEVKREELLEVHGCGVGTAEEILRWLAKSRRHFRKNIEAKCD
jgi:hypothetical protein